MQYQETIFKYQPFNEQEENDQKVILSFIEQHKDTILTRENEIAHMTSSGLILNQSLDKMLMIHHNIYNTWAWTGGHADGEANLLTVALKEAKEETGLVDIVPLTEEIASIDILPVLGHVKRGKYVSAHLHLNVTYILIADEYGKLIINQDETSGLGWKEVDKLDQYSNEPYMVGVYQKIINKARMIKKL